MLARHLHEAGAALTVTDVRDDLVAKAAAEFGATALAPHEIHAVSVDVFAPCALGAVLNDETIPQIKAKIISGLANNPLKEMKHDDMLTERGITYIPDYVVNAGGMMGASTAIFSELSHEKSIWQIEKLNDTITAIINRAKTEGNTTAMIADTIAEERIKATHQFW